MGELELYSNLLLRAVSQILTGLSQEEWILFGITLHAAA